jgi:radical SAM protein with 4Fe4S-binding SPASM domain
MSYRQDPPFAVQVELVEGCTLSCEFCGINGIREKPGNFKFMDLADVLNVGNRLKEAIELHKWNPRIEFAMHGEPSMHPQLDRCITILRHLLPRQTMVLFSNGSGFVKNPDMMNHLLELGLNAIGLDAYEHVNIVPRVMEGYAHVAKYPVFRYPQQKEHSLHVAKRKVPKSIVVIQDISKADEGNHSSLNTHCGGGMKPPATITARCAKPFRELAIRWDGNVALCCNDFRGVYKVANITDMPLEELWNHRYFDAARRILMTGNRHFTPCSSCNAKSMRVGLLPDKMGKVTMPEPTEDDFDDAAKAVGGEAFTPPVRRLWEIEPGTENFPVGDHVYPLNILDRKKLQ